MPHLNALVDSLAEEVNGGDVVFLAVSDESEEAVLASLERHPMESWVASDPDGSASSAMGVRALPTTFLIDREGRVAWRGHPQELQADAIRTLVQ